MSFSQANPLPKTCKAALLYEYGQGLRIEDIPTPQPVHGAVVIKVESAPIYGPLKQVLVSKPSFFAYPTPFVMGGAAIGRVAAVGPDTTTLKPGQLVMSEYYIRARDNPNGVRFLRAASTFGNPLAEQLASDVYRHGSLAEYQLVAHENCHPLDENLLLGSPSKGGLGYKLPHLGLLCFQAICYNGLRDIGIKAGETLVVMPATGVFGGCAVEVASAMGARIVAAGRNIEALRKLEKTVQNVKTVRLIGDADADTAAITQCYGPVDAYFDISPPTIPNTQHISVGLASLANYGRVSFMGGLGADIPINYGICVQKGLTLKGGFMYEREAVKEVIKLAYTGNLKLGQLDVKEFKLEDWKEAFDVAEKTHAWGNLVSITI